MIVGGQVHTRLLTRIPVDQGPLPSDMRYNAGNKRQSLQWSSRECFPLHRNFPADLPVRDVEEEEQNNGQDQAFFCERRLIMYDLSSAD